MTKLLFAAAIVAALAVVATAKPLSANDPTPMSCLECTLLGKWVEVLRKEGKTKEQIDQDVQVFCTRLPMPLKNQCTNVVTTQLEPLLAALEQTNGQVKPACTQLGKCAAVALHASRFDCLDCEVQAAWLEEAVETNTKAQIDANLTAICQKLPEKLKAPCLANIANIVDPLIDELAKNPNDTARQACQVLQKCPASSGLEELVENLVKPSVGITGKCFACSIEAAILSKAVQNNTKAQIDAKLAELCAKLPDQLRVKCNNAIVQKVDPIIDEITTNPNENPKQVCHAVHQCHGNEADEELVQLVETVTNVKNSPLDCIACGVETALLSKALQNNTKAQIDAKLAELCAKLPDQFRVKCNNAIAQQIDPIIDQLTTNPNETPKQVCQAVNRCAAGGDEVLEQLVESVTTVQASPVDCFVCGVEAALLSKALQNNTKEQIDYKLTNLCFKLPHPLSSKCDIAIVQKIDPILYQLTKYPSETPKQVCQAVNRCAARPHEELEQLVESVTTVKNSRLDCIVCGVEAALLSKAFQTKTQAQIDMELDVLCTNLPDQRLRVKCINAVAQKVDPIIDVLKTNPNENPKAVCQAVQRCPADKVANELVQLVESVTNAHDSPVDCIVCAVEAAVLSKALQNNTKAQIDAKLAELCAKLPDQLRVKCNNAIAQKVDPIIDEVAKNPNENPKQVCQAVQRCPADKAAEELVQLVESVTTVKNSPLDCIVCGVEAALLSKALQNNTKAQIDAKLAELCAKLPDQLRVKCNNAIAQKVDPIIDVLTTNPNENPKQVCQAVQRCPADKVAEELVQLVESVTTGEASRGDCLVCDVEADLVRHALKNNTKAQIDAHLTDLCAKLPDQLRVKCNNAIVQKIDPIIDILATNPNQTPKQVCQAVQRCPADKIEEEDFEDLAAVIAPSVENMKPEVDCAICGLESAILAKALVDGRTKAQIDDKITMLCNKLPAKLAQPCLNGLNNKINPIIDALMLSQNDPKKACQAVNRCPV